MSVPSTCPPRSSECSLEELALEAPHDTLALERLLARIHPEVTRYCQARLDQGSSIHSGEDVAQEVCLAIVKALPSYRHEGTTFWSFVFSIAACRVTDTYRRTSTATRYIELTADVPETYSPGVDPEEAALRSEQAALMNRLLDRLPAHQRSILLLRVQGGLSTPETARILNSTPGAIRVAQHRALNTIRKALQEQRADERAVAGGERAVC